MSLFCFTAPIQPTFATIAPTEAYESRNVGNIDITVEYLPPNASFDPKIILSKMKTKAGDPFSQLTFDSDLKMLSNEYDRVEPTLEINNGEVYITLKLWPRPKIRTIKWTGNEHIKTKELQKELGIKPKSTFNRQTFNNAFNKVKEVYIKKGYFESQLQYTLSRDSKTNEVDILITVKEGRSGQIDDIVFKGFTSIEKSELLEMIYTKKYNLFTSWLTGSGTYNEEALEQDQLTITNYLQNKGFADAKVEVHIREAKSKGKIIIEIDADRGQVYHFGRITFRGNKMFTDQEIESRFFVHPGDVYSPDKLRDTSQAIKDLYGRKGHIDANIQYESNLVENEPKYNVSFQISEGEQYKIGLIRIFGNVQTESRVILHESLLIPGETFDSAKLKATQRRLENIGYFKSVNVYAVRTQDDQSLGENYRDVYIEVEETTTGNVSLFFGFSTADQLFGGLDLGETNFNYRGIPRIFKDGLSALRGGGEYAHIRASIGGKQRSYALSWLTPYFHDTLWRVGFDLNKTNSRLQSKDYDINTYGFSFYASYPLNPYWTFSTKYRVRDSIISVSHHNTTRKERDEIKSTGIISAISSSIGFDNCDSSMKPHNGFRSVIEGEFAGVFGKFSFAKIGYTNSYYTELWKHGIMKYRFDFKFIEPFWKSPHFNDIPISERFFLGGENSVRGYKPFDLGPHYKKNGDPKGGISSGLLSVEYLHEVHRLIDLFMFADAGCVSRRHFSLKHWNLSWGVGTRLEIINRMPVILGYGFAINPDHIREPKKDEDGKEAKHRHTRTNAKGFWIQMGGQF